MSTHIAVIDALARSARAGESVVLATVVRVLGSSYGGVGTRMVIRVDGTTVGIVSGGCLESDLTEHALRVHSTGRAEVVSYDTRYDDDAVWGLGLGCNGLIDVLLEPLCAEDAASVANLLHLAIGADSPSALATVVASRDGTDGDAIGSHALFLGERTVSTGNLDQLTTEAMRADREDALAAGRSGLSREYGSLQVAFEVVTPVIRLVVCGSGPDALPVARIAGQLGWDVIVVDHRVADDSHAERFPWARVMHCPDPADLARAAHLTPRTAAVVMSHNFMRDTAYVDALVRSGAAYVGVLGPRTRTERMLTELESRSVDIGGVRLFAPVGMDLGGDGPDAIALAIVAEVSAVLNGREGGHLTNRQAPLHSYSEPATTRQL